MLEFATQGSARNAGHRLNRHRMAPQRVMRSALLARQFSSRGARCTATKKPFAIRFEQGVSGIWQACAAFAISERQLSNPAFSSDEVTSSASVSSSYPGCPHCGADPRKEFAGVSFVQCSCGKLACSTGIIGAENLCPWCDRVGILARHGRSSSAWDEGPLSIRSRTLCRLWLNDATR